MSTFENEVFKRVSNKEINFCLSIYGQEYAPAIISKANKKVRPWYLVTPVIQFIYPLVAILLSWLKS